MKMMIIVDYCLVPCTVHYISYELFAASEAQEMKYIAPWFLHIKECCGKKKNFSVSAAGSSLCSSSDCQHYSAAGYKQCPPSSPLHQSVTQAQAHSCSSIHHCDNATLLSVTVFDEWTRVRLSLPLNISYSPPLPTLCHGVAGRAFLQLH